LLKEADATGRHVGQRGCKDTQRKESTVAVATFVKFQILLSSANVSVKPNPKALPGTPALEKLIDGLAAIALLGCVAAVLIGAAQWALGSKSNNYSQTADGRSKVLYGALGAFIVGAAAAIINFFEAAGSAVNK
jgi:hypothetical protein